jgi:hypothetical protein
MVYLSAGMSVPRLINLRDIRRVMNYKLDWMLKESRYHSICQEGLSNTTRDLLTAGDRAEIVTRQPQRLVVMLF